MILEFIIYFLVGALLVLAGYKKGKKDGHKEVLKLNDSLAVNIFNEGYRTGFSMCRVQAIEDLPTVQIGVKKKVAKKKKSK